MRKYTERISERIMFNGFEKNKIKTGFKEVMNLISENKAAKAFIAEDCDEIFKERFTDAAQKAGVSFEYVPTMKELGKACGIEVGASCAAIIR